MSIFLSINAKDIERAKSLERVLLTWGFNDVWYMNQICGGDQWPKKIIDHAKKAKFCLILEDGNGLTFTQGIEVGAATAENVNVIPIVFNKNNIELLPDYIRSLQVRILPEDVADSRKFWKSRLIHDLHPFYIPRKVYSKFLDLSNLVVEASTMDCVPETRLSLQEIQNRHPKIKITKFERTVAIATTRQQKVAVSHLTQHHTCTDFIDFLTDGTDVHFQDKFNVLASSLRKNGISDQIILRTYVLADSSAVQAWEKL